MSEGDTAPRAGGGGGGDLPPNNTLYCNNLNDKIKIGGLFGSSCLVPLSFLVHVFHVCCVRL